MCDVSSLVAAAVAPEEMVFPDSCPHPRLFSMLPYVHLPTRRLFGHTACQMHIAISPRISTKVRVPHTSIDSIEGCTHGGALQVQAMLTAGAECPWRRQATPSWLNDSWLRCAHLRAQPVMNPSLLHGLKCCNVLPCAAVAAVAR
eukprot:37897-Chlamydomonas_euryale.AAC.9